MCFLEIQGLGDEIQWLDPLSMSLNQTLNGTDMGWEVILSIPYLP